MRMAATDWPAIKKSPRGIKNSSTVYRRIRELDSRDTVHTSRTQLVSRTYDTRSCVSRIGRGV